MLGAYYGFYFLEVANYYAREFNDELEMLKLLYQTMRALTNPHIPDALIFADVATAEVMLNETPSLTLGALTPEEWAAHLDEAIKQNVQ